MTIQQAIFWFSLNRVRMSTLAVLLIIQLIATSYGEALAPVGNVVSLDVYVDGSKIHVLFTDKHPGLNASYLWYQRSADQAQSWSNPVRVDSGSPPPYEGRRGNDFQIAAFHDRIVAIWMTKGTGFMGRGPLVSVCSEDGGGTWSPGPNPADDESNGDHAFIDLTADSQGNFHAVWLDKRNGQTKGLYMATSKNGGKTWSKNIAVDSATCDCCWNVVITDPNGNLYVLYRDLSPRDMGLAISANSGKTWSLGKIGDGFDWNFDGCPHVGGGLAMETSNGKSRLHTVVWTGKKDQTGVYYTNSVEKGRKWAPRERLGTINARFPDIAVNTKGHLAAVWDDISGGEPAIFLSTSANSGNRWSKPRPLSLPGVDATHARVVSLDEKFHVFWTEIANKKTVLKHTVL